MDLCQIDNSLKTVFFLLKHLAKRNIDIGYCMTVISLQHYNLCNCCQLTSLQLKS
jgi:hypothetical protein